MQSPAVAEIGKPTIAAITGLIEKQLHGVPNTPPAH